MWSPADGGERPEADVDFGDQRSLADLLAGPTLQPGSFAPGTDVVDGPLPDSPGYIAPTGLGEPSPARPRSIPTSNNFLDSILNPPEAVEPYQTPESVGSLQPGAPAENPAYDCFASPPSVQPPPETGARVAFLLRHFSEGPGKWYAVAVLCRPCLCNLGTLTSLQDGSV